MRQALDLQILRPAETKEWDEFFTGLNQFHQEYFKLLEDFGRAYASQLEGQPITAARESMLALLKHRLGQWVPKDELRLIAAIDEWARRLRELRVQEGWSIRTIPRTESAYLLSDLTRDKDAESRWTEINAIRTKKGSTPQERMLALLKKRCGTPVRAEILADVAKKSQWESELEALRTQHGWRISSSVDRPGLDEEYILESTELLPPEDWDIPEKLRGEVMDLDNRMCVRCKWQQYSTDDKWLEVHRLTPGHEPKCFATLCSDCHFELHDPTQKPIRIKLDRKPSMTAAVWESYFAQEIPPLLAVDEVGPSIQRLLQRSTQISGKHLPHIREINVLKQGGLWTERAARLIPIFERRFGTDWPSVVGAALRPPLSATPGDGLEHLLTYLLRQFGHHGARCKVNLSELFPGESFPDAKQIDVYVPGEQQRFFSLKWSLRGDRLQLPQLEAKNLRMISPNIFFGVVTCEYDFARLAPLLADDQIDAVYHIDQEGLLSIWSPEGVDERLLTHIRDIRELFSRGTDGISPIAVT